MDLWCNNSKMAMRTMVVFGGSGGLGKKVIPLLRDKYNIISPTSTDVNVSKIEDTNMFFANNDVDIVLNLSAKMYNCFISGICDSDYYYVKEMVDVNVLGNINILSSCLPYLERKGWGRVIAASSIFSLQNVPQNSIYSASKAFLDRLISSANKESIRHGVTCNTIQLGYWDGGMSERIDMDSILKAKAKIGLRRFGTELEFSSAINFIIDNEYVCGTNLRIDGGM